MTNSAVLALASSNWAIPASRAAILAEVVSIAVAVIVPETVASSTKRDRVMFYLL